MSTPENRRVVWDSNMTTQDLKQIEPNEALDLYLNDKRRECVQSTIDSHERRLQYFIDWFTAETDYDHLRELDGLDLRRWRVWRFDDDHSDAYIKTVQDTVRVFLRFAGDIEAVPTGLANKVHSPEGGDQRSNEIDGERAREVLEYLDRYEYATVDHVVWQLLWYGMLRLGAVHSIDIDDIDTDDGYIQLEHRPGTDTRLKNQDDANRTVSIRPSTSRIIEDYIDHSRHDVTDDHDRDPLLTTENGRAHRNTIRTCVYAWSRPCKVGRDCPHGEDPDSCEAAQRRNDAHRCNSSESTHAIRRGSISWHLREETPKTVVGDRADVTPEVIDEHYSTLSQREKADVRRDQLPDDL